MKPPVALSVREVDEFSVEELALKLIEDQKAKVGANYGYCTALIDGKPHGAALRPSRVRSYVRAGKPPLCPACAARERDAARGRTSVPVPLCWYCRRKLDRDEASILRAQNLGRKLCCVRPKCEREASRASTLKWRVANPEKAREAERKWRAANPEKVREAERKWRAANPEKRRENNRKWRAAAKAEGRCRDCGAPAAPGRTRCAACLARNAAAWRARYAKKKAAAQGGVADSTIQGREGSNGDRSETLQGKDAERLLRDLEHVCSSAEARQRSRDARSRLDEMMRPKGVAGVETLAPGKPDSEFLMRKGGR